MNLSDSIFIRAPPAVVFSLVESSAFRCELTSSFTHVEETSPPQLGRKTLWFSSTQPKTPNIEVITGYRPPRYLASVLYSDLKQENSIAKAEFALEETPEGNTTLQITYSPTLDIQEEDRQRIIKEIRQILAGIKIKSQKL